MSNDAAKLHRQGVALLTQGKFEAALDSFRQSVASTPHPATHYDIGNALIALGRFAEAVESFDAALALRPGFSQALNNRAGALEELGRYDEALESYARAIAAVPNNAAAHYNRGNIFLKILRQPQDAVACFDRAVSVDPKFVGAYINRGAALQGVHRYAEASASFDMALALAPLNPDAQWNKAWNELLLGDFKNGWLRYEWRWRTAEQKPWFRAFPRPLWLGDFDLADKTIFLHAEQGMGDVLQFCRYVPLVAAQARHVVLEVHPPLSALMTPLAANLTVINRGDPLPPFDAHTPLLSLPLAFKTTLDTIPARSTYLSADAAAIERWTGELGAKRRPRIGLVWTGGALHKNDFNRSIGFSAMTPLLEIDAEFHCLQKELRPGEAAPLQTATIKTHAFDLATFADTAALATHMDLIVSVDTAVAHLAGALGKPVWILLPYDADFRWLTERADSPWYPTARLFRQSRAGDWAGVVADVAAAMRGFCHGSTTVM